MEAEAYGNHKLEYALSTDFIYVFILHVVNIPQLFQYNVKRAAPDILNGSFESFIDSNSGCPKKASLIDARLQLADSVFVRL